MKGLVHAVVFTNLVAALIFPGIASALGNRFFIGLWEGVDQLDGSTITVSISDNDKNGTLEVRNTESFFATCIAQNKGYSGSPGLIEGSGTVEGKTLNWSFSFKCYDPSTNSLVEIQTGTASYEANRKDNILVDGFGNVFHRVGKR